jgi:hypothetical protein
MAETTATGTPQMAENKFAMKTSRTRTSPARLNIIVSTPTIGSKAISARSGCGKNSGTATFATIVVIRRFLPNDQAHT